MSFLRSVAGSRRFGRFALAGFGLLLVGLAAESASLVLSYRDLRAAATDLEGAQRALTRSGPGGAAERSAEAGSLRRAASERSGSARSRLGQDPGIRLGSLVPVLRDQIAAIRDLAETASEATLAAGDLAAVLDTYSRETAAGGPPGPILVRVAILSRAPLVTAQARLDRADERLRRDLDRPLWAPLRGQVRSARGRLETPAVTVGAAAEAADYLPRILGQGRPQSYLVLFPNPAELRPAGGFTATVGVLTVRDGQPDLEVRDAQTLNGRYRHRFAPPEPLGRYLSFANNSLEISDAGWDADFPSSAALSEQMLEDAVGTRADGTISIDPFAVAALLRIVGPVEVPGLGRFDADNFYSRIDTIVNVDYYRSPSAPGKNALQPIAQAVLARLLARSPSEWPAILDSFREQASRRHLQVALHDPVPAAALSRAHFDGRVLAVPGSTDYLMIVDANVGGTKGDFYVGKEAELRAEVTRAGVVRHELILRYAYPKDAVDPTVLPGHNLTYRNYLRLYLPEASMVTALYALLDGQPANAAIDSVAVANGKQVVGLFISVPPGRAIEVHAYYRTNLAPRAGYRLFIQKQAGPDSRPLRLRASLPGRQVDIKSDGSRDRQLVIAA